MVGELLGTRMTRTRAELARQSRYATRLDSLHVRVISVRKSWALQVATVARVRSQPKRVHHFLDEIVLGQLSIDIDRGKP